MKVIDQTSNDPFRCFILESGFSQSDRDTIVLDNMLEKKSYPAQQEDFFRTNRRCSSRNIQIELEDSFLM